MVFLNLKIRYISINLVDPSKIPLTIAGLGTLNRGFMPTLGLGGLNRGFKPTEGVEGA